MLKAHAEVKAEWKAEQQPSTMTLHARDEDGNVETIVVRDERRRILVGVGDTPIERSVNSLMVLGAQLGMEVLPVAHDDEAAVRLAFSEPKNVTLPDGELGASASLHAHRRIRRPKTSQSRVRQGCPTPR